MYKKVSTIYKYLMIIISFLSLLFTTGLLDGRFNIKIFLMFTTLSNLLCLVYYIISLACKKSFPYFYGLVIVCLTITFFVAQFVLKMSFSFDSYESLSFLGLHYLVPIMIVIDYILFYKKGLFKKSYPLLWICFPLIYFILCLIFKTYTYPFIDINLLGVSKVLVNVIIIGICYILIGYIICAIDYVMSKKQIVL